MDVFYRDCPQFNKILNNVTLRELVGVLLQRSERVEVEISQCVDGTLYDATADVINLISRLYNGRQPAENVIGETDNI